MSTLKADAIEAATGTNTDLDLAGKGTGVPDIAAGFKVGGVAGVPTASIQADAVTTAKINDDAVTTAKINDDAVTLAKLAAGTDGELITWDASGDPAAVAVGTATHVLTSNGAGAAPTFQAAGGGAWSLVSTTVASDSASLAVTGLSLDKTYAVIIQNLIPASGNQLELEFGTSAGGYVTTGYKSTVSVVNTTPTTSTGVVTTHVQLSLHSDTMSTNRPYQGSFILTMKTGAEVSVYLSPQIFGVMCYGDSGGGGVSGHMMGGIGNGLAAVDRIKVAAESGNITAGRLTVWEITNA